jgi:hypothetical protein
MLNYIFVICTCFDVGPVLLQLAAAYTDSSLTVDLERWAEWHNVAPFTLFQTSVRKYCVASRRFLGAAGSLCMKWSVAKFIGDFCRRIPEVLKSWIGVWSVEILSTSCCPAFVAHWRWTTEIGLCDGKTAKIGGGGSKHSASFELLLTSKKGILKTYKGMGWQNDRSLETKHPVRFILAIYFNTTAVVCFYDGRYYHNEEIV